MSFYVSRQKYWGEDRNVVEVAIGGLNYANPDMLVAKFDGEGQEYDDPREAARAAIKVQKAWMNVCPICNPELAYGFTGGATMYFDAVSEEGLLQWAEEQYESLEKCAKCGCILGKEKFHLLQSIFDEQFCSEYCAEEYLAGEANDNSESVLD